MKTQPKKKKLKAGNNQHTSDVARPWKQNKTKKQQGIIDILLM